MNRPESIKNYDEIDLKLGIKSSLPNIKSTLALAVLLWECADRPATLKYSTETNGEIIIDKDIEDSVINFLADICAEEDVNETTLISTINKNQLFKSQMEALIVAFELIWKLAKVSFVDINKPASSERTGGVRYAKMLSFSINADIIHSIIASNREAYIKVLMSWIGFKVAYDVEHEKNLMELLVALSENAVFKMTDGDKDVVFNQNSIYSKLLETSQSVDLNGDKEAKGSLRILKSLLSDGMNPHLIYSNGSVETPSEHASDLAEYQKRVDTFLSLSATKIMGAEALDRNEQGLDDLLTPAWFKQEAEQLGTIDEEAEELYKEFKERFSPETLKSLDGVDLLHKIFLNETNNKDSLCYVLEYDKRFNIFGSVAGGSAYKYGLFYSKNNQSWMAGTSSRQKRLTQEEAISLGKQIRDEIVSGADIIANYGEIAELKDYANLNAKLYEVMPNTINKSWVIMYYHMMFPQIFPVFYNEDWQRKVLDKIRIEAEQNSFIRMGQIALFVKDCGISNVAFSKIVTKADFPVFANETSKDSEQLSLNYSYDSSKGGAQNIVIYGTPGCGKSFYVQNTLLNKFSVEEDNRIRTTFYQDYTNTDFVGQILPRVYDDKSVTYEFNPGPFALALKKAIEFPDIYVALIIEELNRGNAASIFGDIFQLLDRDETGKSRYGITNVYLQDYLNDYFNDRDFSFASIYIPSNLYIVATMNTSDQNVFTLDTAFKRRWQFEKIRNEFKDDHEYKGYYIPGMNQITWENLATSINDYIVNSSNELSSEDKQLGVYFVDKNTLCETLDDCKNEEKKKKFAYKLFEYLWDDVAKFSRPDWFGGDIKSLDQLIDAYLKNGEKVFVDGIIKQSDEN